MAVMRRGVGTSADGPMGYFFLLSLGVGLGLQTHWSTYLQPRAQPASRGETKMLPSPRILTNSTPTQNLSRTDSQNSPYVMCKLWGIGRGHAPGLVRPKRVHGRHSSGGFLPQSPQGNSARTFFCLQGRSTLLELQRLNAPLDESEEGTLGLSDHPSLKSTSLSLCKLLSLTQVKISPFHLEGNSPATSIHEFHISMSGLQRFCSRGPTVIFLLTKSASLMETS